MPTPSRITFPTPVPTRRHFEAGLNYIRNSVKVVVDMYDGDVRFYVMDPNDPVMAVYRRAFPGVFLDLNQLSRGSESASAVSGGSLFHPGRSVQNVPHDGSAGLL